MYNFFKKIPINGLRNPRIIKFQENLILIGSHVYTQKNSIKKYVLMSYLLDKRMNIIDNSKKILNFKNIEESYLDDINTSIWLRDLYFKDNEYYLLVEFKKNIKNKYFIHDNYLLCTKNFNNFLLKKKLTTKNFLFSIYKNINFTSNIKNTDDFNWGIYLFEFIFNNKKYIPKFDNCVDYKNDKGHALHNINKLESGKYKILFSIRNQISLDKLKFKYKIYTAETKDFVNFYNTKELQINNFKDRPNWYCYPSIFYNDKKEYIICNQDDFGKEKYPLIFKKIDQLKY
jgi:hypothetical protein